MNIFESVCCHKELKEYIPLAIDYLKPSVKITVSLNFYKPLISFTCVIRLNGADTRRRLALTKFICSKVIELLNKKRK